MDKYPIAASSLEKYYHVDGKLLERQYKDSLSEYRTWVTTETGKNATSYLIFPENMGPHLSIDETSISDGELYTIVCNKDAHGKKGALVAIIEGTAADAIVAVLLKISAELRNAVVDITLDLSSSMDKIVRTAFPKATKVIDRFHVQKLALEALQDMRIDFRWEAMDRENKAIAQNRLDRKIDDTVPVYEPEVFTNGDTEKQLLVRSRYLLFKSREKWTEKQKKRAKILFDRFPDLECAYNLTDELRKIYSSSKTKPGGYTKLAHWYRHVEEAGYDQFLTVKETVHEHYSDILNFFENRATNASAESFNAKIKAFRAQLRGVVDKQYFFFRLMKIYA